jgi:hypothetical protein
MIEFTYAKFLLWSQKLNLIVYTMQIYTFTLEFRGGSYEPAWNESCREFLSWP